MIASVHPVRIHRAQVLDLEFDQGLRQLCGITKLDSEFI